jgi:hypothetical protein
MGHLRSLRPSVGGLRLSGAEIARLLLHRHVRGIIKPNEFLRWSLDALEPLFGNGMRNRIVVPSFKNKDWTFEPGHGFVVKRLQRAEQMRYGIQTPLVYKVQVLLCVM